MDLAVKKYGYKGVKFHPVHYTLHPFGRETVAILKRAAEYDIPVLFHCSDEMMCLPLQIEEAYKQSPETKVILAHSGGFFHMDDAIRIVARNKNMYMDTCENASIEGLKKAVRTVGAEKVLFGTDIPTDNPLFEIEKIKALELSKEEEDLIFYKNIARLLHLNV
jgi:predicted TIM-barrel fold metal-dependent hydrolase